MRRAIITPTFKKHFCFIKKYLNSFDKYLLDRDFPICFIIAKSENKDFEKLISKYKKSLNIKVFFLEDILKRFDIEETPEELMTLYGRLSFQTIKKIYGALYIAADQFLFLDSESMLIKPTNMTSLFEEYFKAPKFFISRINNRKRTYNANFTYEFINAITSLMGEKAEYYTTESYEWFYELRILKDSIKKMGEPIDVIRNYNMPDRHPNLEGILEALWYYQYILYNNIYGYKIYETDEELKKFLGNKYHSFKYSFDSSPFWAVGILEVLTKFINKDNIKELLNFYNKYNFSVIRMQMPLRSQNFEFQLELLNHSNIHILASNQEHLFVSGFKKSSKTFSFLIKNINTFIYPFKQGIRWIFSIFNIFIALFKILVGK